MTNQNSDDLDSLIGSLREGALEERISAAMALGAQADKIRELWLDEGPSQPAVLALIAALDDPEWKVRSEAADALAALGGTAIEALPALLARVESDQELSVSVTATWAVEEIARDSGLGAYDAEAIPVLIKALGHQAPEMRIAAVSALGELVLTDPQEVIAALARVVKQDDDAEVREAAQSSIERLSSGANLT